jgi:hypothetical protein
VLDGGDTEATNTAEMKENTAKSSDSTSRSVEVSVNVFPKTAAPPLDGRLIYPHTVGKAKRQLGVIVWCSSVY